MAVETQTAPTEEVVVAESEKQVVKQPPPPPPTAAEDDPKKPLDVEQPPSGDPQKPSTKEKVSAIPPSVSFKEESNLVSDLADPEKQALDELKQLIQAALANHEFTPPPPPPAPVEEPPSKVAEAKPEETAAEVVAEEDPASQTEEKAVVVDDDGAKTVEAIAETVVPVAAPPPPPEQKTSEATAVEEEEKAPVSPPEEVFIWGIPLLGDERSDTVLLKFLRARDFKVKEAMAMIKNAVAWRKEFGIEGLLDEDLGVPELERVVFMHGLDREGHPVCYNVYGEFLDKELYGKAFADEEKKKRFLWWRIQFLESGIRRLLDFSPGGVSTMVQVTDLKNSQALLKRELRPALALLQDNYPEFAAKQVFINVPWWYLAFNRMISPFFTQRSKSKFVFAGASKSAETLFRYISPEQIPVQYGGLSKENDPDFTSADAVAEATLKPSMKQVIEIPVTEASLLVWEIRVLGWDVTYGAEFVPSSADGYTVIVQKARKLAPTDEPVVRSTFRIAEAGKVVLTVANTPSKKKKLLYRYKAKSCSY